jgi:glycosyltransferase involved in cell wall biosynthesis
MKIVLLSHDFPEYCIQQANGLARHADVTLMLPEIEAEEYLPALDPAVRYQPFVKWRLRQPGRQIMEACRVLKRIRSCRPDVVHYQHGHLWFNLALPALRGYPLVVTVHDPRPHAGDRASRKTPRWVMNLGYRRADRLIVHGEEIKRQVVTLLGAQGRRVHSIPHIAIGCQSGSTRSIDQGNAVLFFGRIWEYKGLEYLIRAAPAITRAIPDAHFIIAGEGEDFDRYRRLMTDPSRFTVHNRYITAAERDALFERAAVVVLPYIEATQSGVIPIAYSFGKPVVATRVGALEEAVDDGVTGYLVPPRDEHALATAVIDVLQDPQRRLQLGLAGRRKLAAEGSPSVIASQTFDVYRQAIDDRCKQGVAWSRKNRAVSPDPRVQ